MLAENGQIKLIFSIDTKDRKGAEVIEQFIKGLTKIAGIIDSLEAEGFSTSGRWISLKDIDGNGDILSFHMSMFREKVH